MMLMGLSEVALRANIPYYYNLPDEVQDGLRKLVNGFDDGGVKSSAGTGTGVAASTSDGYALLRFLARNYAGFEYNGDMTEMTITDDYVHASLPSSFVSVNSNVVTINAASSTLTLNISGNESPNVIVGTSAADTINGKVGNDTISGGEGNDVFIYTSGEGNDVITDYTDYTAQDKLRITGTYSTLTSGNDVVVKVGTGQMTLKNAKGVKLNITKAAAFEERWFLEDDDAFTTSEVTSILKSDNFISNDYKLNSELNLNQDGDIASLTYNISQKK